MEFFREDAFVIFFILADRNHLGCAGLSCDRVRTPPSAGPTRTPWTMHHISHGSNDLIEFCINDAVRLLTAGLRLRLGDLFAAQWVFLRKQYSRSNRDSAIRQRSRHPGELHGCGHQKSLPDHGDEVFPRKPGFISAGPFPLRGWDQACRFLGKIDTGYPAEAETGQHLCHHIDAESSSHFIKVNVTGFLNGPMQIHGPVASFPPASITSGAVGQGKPARTVNPLLRIDARIDDGPGNNRFDGRAGGIAAVQRPVEKRSVFQFTKRIV